MGLIRALFGQQETKVLDASPLLWRTLLGAGGLSHTGLSINVDSALRVATVLACVRVLAEGIAQLPFKLYQEEIDETRTPAKDHPLYPILWRRPNDWQTSFEWRETMMLHALLTHGGYSLINRSSDGRVLELLPLLPSNVRPIQRPDWTLAYEIVDGKGAIATVPRSALFVLRGPSWNTYSGLEVVRQAAEAIGLAIASDESMARLHGNGTRPSGILSTEMKLTKEQLDRIREAFQAVYSGVSNAGKTMVLDGGLKFTQTSLSPADARTTESRQQVVEELCRAFRVFPQMIGSTSMTTTYASAESFFSAHVVHSLNPWMERLEQATARDLLTRDELGAGYYAKLSADGLLRGDSKARAEFYASGIVNGWLTRNEARKREDLNPRDGLDDPLAPLNMAPAGQSTSTPAQVKSLARAIALEIGRPDLEAKIGRVLSASNEGKLRQARALLDEVIVQVEEVSA